MKILKLSTGDIQAGGFIAAYRLLKGLQNINIDVSMLVQAKSTIDDSIVGSKSPIAKLAAKLRWRLDDMPKILYPNRKQTMYSLQWMPDFLISQIEKYNPDIVHFHWICRGFVNIKTLARIKKPMVWTLHDMWTFTGGCHYDHECGRYRDQCGACPQLGSHQEHDLSRGILQSKHASWNGIQITFVTPSRWLADCARKSALLRHQNIQIIPYGLDLNIFFPQEKKVARSNFKLPINGKLIVFGAANGIVDERKGFKYLQSALKILADKQWRSQAIIGLFGDSSAHWLPDLGIPVYFLGKFTNEESLAQLYSAADIFVAPSVQDNLPNTVMEAMACGTPVVAFNIGGMPDMIDHQVNGYLSQPYEADDLASGIAWVLEDEKRHQILCQQARKKCEESFFIEMQSQRYLTLYNNMLNERH